MSNVQNYFKFYKTFDDIVKNPWAPAGDGKINGVPTTYFSDVPLDIADIKYWEQLYHEPGNLGIYAAHTPCSEIYFLIFFLLDNYIEKYSGQDAANKVFQRAKDLGIFLKAN